MKFYVSYFYAVRFMQSNCVPLSTAISDPKWFHANLGPSHTFLDKNGVRNGLRAEPFVPKRHEETEGYCGHCDKDNTKCLFMKYYREQLRSLDISNIMSRFESIAARVCPLDLEPHLILLVHEAPDNPCSERWALLDWFTENGIAAQEYPVPKREKKKKEQVFLF